MTEVERRLILEKLRRNPIGDVVLYIDHTLHALVRLDLDFGIFDFCKGVPRARVLHLHHIGLAFSTMVTLNILLFIALVYSIVS